MQRRDFLKLAAAASLTGCSERLPWQAPPVGVHMPGMELGHRLRDRLPTPNPTRERSVDVAILGSGVAGLFAGWRLAQAGYRNFCLLGGPEPLGNTAGSLLGGVPCPTGAHYLPLAAAHGWQGGAIAAGADVIIQSPHKTLPSLTQTALLHWNSSFIPPQELERQLRELGDTMSDSFRHGFEGRGEELGDRAWNVGRAAANAASEFSGAIAPVTLGLP